MYEVLKKIIFNSEFNTIESFEVPGRQAEFTPIPEFLNTQIADYMNHRSSLGLWTHQARALEILSHGDNVVISTGTASGKSLIFQALALHKLLGNPDSRALVFYPLKALIADQLSGWFDMAQKIGLKESDIGQIDGSIDIVEREAIMKTSKIVLMTPDVCHAWMMPRIGMEIIRDFIGSLSTLIIDEAHTLEGVFGSNFAFLIRRLTAARNHILGGQVKTNPLQIVATTATIANPANHLEKLTGAKFFAVDHEMDRAPQQNRIVAHIECPENQERTIAKSMQDYILAEGTDGSFITFVDSRKGAELLAITNENVLPYRAGYDKRDRRRIEKLLRAGELRGIVSTSALELGIDIPHLQVGINVGIPLTRKSYRQRLGRVARNNLGGFIVIAPKNAFRRYGTSFEEYHNMSVEPSYLYLDNRFMQFAHGRCLVDELEVLKAPSSLPTHIQWPVGFGDVYSSTKPGGNRPQEFDAIAERGGDIPHHNYPLRNDGEINFEIKRSKNSQSFGSMSLIQALRECYPGATYLHMGKYYEVVAWRMGSFDSFIEVKPGRPNRSTQPRIRIWVNASLISADLINGHFRKGENNSFLAECQMQITERVEGYTDGLTGEFQSYRELRQRNPNMRAHSRNFRTSGIVFCIDEEWFKEKSAKQLFADRLREVFVHEYSILPQDVDAVATNISVRTLEGSRHKSGCIAVFDKTSGSLRLTERLYSKFDHILERLWVAGKSDVDDHNLSSIIEQVRDVLTRFSTSDSVTDSSEDTFDGDQGEYIQVFKEGSRVCYRRQGHISEDVEIIKPLITDDGQLLYQVKGLESVNRLVNASRVEESGDASAWDYALWNRATQTYVNLPEE